MSSIIEQLSSRFNAIGKPAHDLAAQLILLQELGTAPASPFIVSTSAEIDDYIASLNVYRDSLSAICLHIEEFQDNQIKLEKATAVLMQPNVEYGVRTTGVWGSVTHAVISIPITQRFDTGDVGAFQGCTLYILNARKTS